MNSKLPVFVICVEAMIYLLLYNLHDYTFDLSLLSVISDLINMTIELFCIAKSWIVKPSFTTVMLPTKFQQVTYACLKNRTKIQLAKHIYKKRYKIHCFVRI